METREYRFLESPELRATAGNVLDGHAAVFNQWSKDLGGFREKILPGAFLRSIAEDNVVATFAHDQKIIPLARNKAGTLELSEDSVGLRSIIHLGDSAIARDVYQSVKRGDLASMSFAFFTKKESWNRSSTERTLIEASLVDVAVVATPAYDGATVSARSLGLPEASEVLIYSGITSLPVSDGERERLRLRVALLRRL